MGDTARVFSPQGGVRIATGWRVNPFPPDTALPLDDEPGKQFSTWMWSLLARFLPIWTDHPNLRIIRRGVTGSISLPRGIEMLPILFGKDMLPKSNFISSYSL